MNHSLSQMRAVCIVVRWTLIVLLVLTARLFADEPDKPQETSSRSIDATAALEQVRQLDKEIEDIAKQEQTLKEALLTKRRMATDGERKWQSILGEIEQNSLQQRDLEQSLKKARKERDEALAKQKESLTAVEAARKELEAAQQRLKEAEAKADKAKAEMQSAEKPMGEWETQLATLAAQIEPLQMAAAKAKEAAVPAMQEVEAMQTRVTDVSSQRLARGQQIETLLKEAGEWISFSDQIAPSFNNGAWLVITPAVLKAVTTWPAIVLCRVPANRDMPSSQAMPISHY